MTCSSSSSMARRRVGRAAPPPPRPAARGSAGRTHLHAKAAAVHKVAIEEVGVAGGGQAVQLKDVEEVVKLAVHVPAHGERLAGRDGHVHQAGQRAQQGLRL